MTTFANQIDKRMAMQNGLIVIDEKKEALYRRLVSPRLMDELKGQIVSELVVKQKFKDPHYTAAKLAEDLGTNTRYISAVVRVRFHTTFTNLVNKMRVEEAMSLLADPRYGELSIEEVGSMAGFLHRQSFHTAFVRFAGTTPNVFRQEHKV